MDIELKNQLKKYANTIRKDVVTEVFNAQSGHPGGSLSIADAVAYLYFKELNVDPANPNWADRDRFVLSKGHTCPALYSALAHKGFFDPAELPSFRKLGHFLQGHPDMKKIPGIDMS
ncbi:MAG: transketolase, partial [Clostridia bacterium]|nr:transketolase [Clostridia bacterium]